MDAKKQQEVFSNMEIEMMTDLYNRYKYKSVRSQSICVYGTFIHRMATACQKKCISPKYREGDLSKGEAICLDRCVAKFLDVHDRTGKKLTEMYMTDAAAMQSVQK